MDWNERAIKSALEDIANGRGSVYVRDREIGAKGAGRIAEAMRGNTSVTRLDLGGDGIGAEGAEKIAELLKDNSTITFLDIAQNDIGIEGFGMIADALMKNASVAGVTLRYNKIGIDGYIAMKMNTSYADLALLWNQNAGRIVAALKENNSLTSLDLSNNSLQSEQVKTIAEGLMENTSITKLELSSNSFRAEGAGMIAEVLKRNILVDLDIGWSNIKNEGAIRIAEALTENTSVAKLTIRGNDITAEGAKSLAEALKMNTSVTYLDLNRNKFGAEGAGSLAEALKENSSLTEIIFWGNDIGNEGAAMVGEALKQNNSVAVLNLDQNKIGNQGAARLAEGLEANTSVQRLGLRENPIEIEGVLSLANGVKYGATAIRALRAGETWNQKPAWQISEDLYKLGEGAFGKALGGSFYDKGAAVLKIPHDESSNDALYETLVLSALPEHDNVVKLFCYTSDMGLEETDEKGKFKRLDKRDDFAVVLVVQLHKNGSLKSYAKGSPVRELTKFLQLSMGMTRAISHLHKYDIIHRDIASRNFVLSDDFQPVLIDFGLSCLAKEGQPARFGVGEVFPYQQSAPETNYSALSTKGSDVWMTGVTMWQMLYIDKGKPFWRFASPKKLREYLKKRYLEKKFEFPLFYKKPKICDEIKELINFCCRFDHFKRPTIDEVITKIEELQEQAAGSDGTSEGFSEGDEVKEGDLSVYGGGEQVGEEYVSYSENDGVGGGMEEYYSSDVPVPAEGSDDEDAVSEEGSEDESDDEDEESGFEEYTDLPENAEENEEEVPTDQCATEEAGDESVPEEGNVDYSEMPPLQEDK